MPINISDKLPAAKILESENIFFLKHAAAAKQDIRPLEIAIVNLMPDKVTTETQLLRLLGNTPIQTHVTLLHPKSYDSKHTTKEHLIAFYRHFDDIQKEKFDGLIITGAPVEHLEFEQVDYWNELTEIMDWSKNHVTSTLHICWAAQAGLYHHYGVPKSPLPEKMFGVFPHHSCVKNIKLLRGFDDVFYVPQSRHTETRKADVEKVKELQILAESPESGLYLVSSLQGRQIFATGHSEYDPLTLKLEYQRDVAKGLPIKAPKNYFPNDNPATEPRVLWRSHANLLFCNWLNYYVYQETPYDLKQII